MIRGGVEQRVGIRVGFERRARRPRSKEGERRDGPSGRDRVGSERTEERQLRYGWAERVAHPLAPRSGPSARERIAAVQAWVAAKQRRGCGGNPPGCVLVFRGGGEEAQAVESGTVSAPRIVNCR